MIIDEFIVDAICEVFASDFEGKVFKNTSRPAEFHPRMIPEKELIGVLLTPPGIPLIGTQQLLQDREFLMKTCLHPKVLECLFQSDLENWTCDWTPIKVSKLSIDENSPFWTLTVHHKKKLNLLGNKLHPDKNSYNSFKLKKEGSANVLFFDDCSLASFSTVWEAKIALQATSIVVNYPDVFFGKSSLSTSDVRAFLQVFEETILPLLRYLPRQYRHLNFELIS